MGFCDQINKELEGYGHTDSISLIIAHMDDSGPYNVILSTLLWAHIAYCKAYYNKTLSWIIIEFVLSSVV